MKKFFGVLLVTVAAIIVVSCSKVDTPTSTVEKALDEIINKGDAETFLDYFLSESSERRNREKTIRRFENYYSDTPEEKQIKSYRILQERFGDGVAVVDYEVTYNNGKTRTYSSSLWAIGKNNKDNWKLSELKY